MALRYPADVLLHLRDSPLCVKPENLPPAEEWMGPPQEQIRTQSKVLGDRPRNSDGPLVDQTNRRPGVERHMSRNSTNPEDLIFGPPRTSFASSRSKAAEGERGSKDLDSQGRFSNLRNRTGDTDGRGNPLRRRGDSDQDNEGWSTVKPRKSFGAEGAERFAGKMGGNFRDEKRAPRDKDDREPTRDRQTRGFDGFSRDRDADGENRTRNGMNRNRLEPWQREASNNDGAAPERRDRDRTKSWRDRDPEPVDNRSNDKRWGRDRDQRGDRGDRAERDPEWFDEPVREQREAHTQQDFQKWMEQMKRAKNASMQDSQSAAEALIESEKPAVKSAPAVEAGPDKFFMAFGGNSAMDSKAQPEQQDSAVPAKKTAGKSSRFTSFFGGAGASDDGRRTEPPAPPSNAPSAPPGFGPGVSGMGAPPGGGGGDDEKQAFQQLLAKLQKQSMSATPPALSLFSAPPPPSQNQGDGGKKSSVTSPEPSQRYGGERRDGPTSRPPQQPEIHAPRPQQQNARPEQLLQDLVGHHQRASSQSSNHREAPPAARNNSNTEFLMNLMRAGPDAQRGDQLQNMISRQQQTQKSPEGGRPAPPPGFNMDEPVRSPDQDPRNPSHMHQRPPPPGLDQMPPNWMHGPPPPGQRGPPMIPPPGLPGGPPNRNMPMPPMFPPNFPPGAMPPPEAMGGMPPRNMPMPPPGFFNGPPPPHGYGPPPGMPGFNGPPPHQGGGPDPRSYGSPPFEGGRGMPPHGEPARGNYRQ
ncbi:hypothetical protein K4F52_009062 [Lecanicillium sp. MT-2017a]|nr:hypothetical protein K4F52_009062 [Lecanicillium sp. MT-2017a]